MRILWPRQVNADQLVTAMRLLASVGGAPVVLEALGQYGRVEHRVSVPEGRAPAVVAQLRAALPGVGIEGVSLEDQLPSFRRAVALQLSTRRRPLQIDRADVVSRSLLTALAQVGKDEAVLLQWVLTRTISAGVVPSKVGGLTNETLWKALVTAPFKAPQPADAETRTALRSKVGEPGWRAIGRVAVRAATPARQQQIVRSVLQAVRTADAPGVGFRARSVSPAAIKRLTGRARMRLNIAEVGTVSAWPVGLTADVAVVRLGSRRLPPPGGLPTTSTRVVGESTWPGRSRPLGLSIADSMHHLHVVGPTGTGKSTLLLRLIEQDMLAGRSVVVIEPKDLIDDVLERVPRARTDDVVLLDPSDTHSVVAINPLAASGGSPEFAADQLLNTLHGLYAANWGVRTADILHASLLTLARTPGMSLVAIPLLLGNPAFRRRLVSHLNDPIGLGPFWAQYEAWSEAERANAVAPVMNKLRPFLMRQNLRRVIGQADAKFQIRSVFTERKILLVKVSKGTIGAEAASLLGALVLSGVWQVAQERAAIPRERRHPVMVYVDEFQDYLHLGTDLGDALAQARGLGVSFTLAHQHLSQLEPSVAAGVMANARSRICFQLDANDAKTMSTRSTILGAEDFSSLDAFHFYAQLMRDGAVGPWTSGRSIPPSRASASADHVRQASRSNYATPIAEIDRALEELVLGTQATQTSTADLAPKRRSGSGGTS
jgi:hypothetical protein